MAILGTSQRDRHLRSIFILAEMEAAGREVGGVMREAVLIVCGFMAGLVMGFSLGFGTAQECVSKLLKAGILKRVA